MSSASGFAAPGFSGATDVLRRPDGRALLLQPLALSESEIMTRGHTQSGNEVAHLVARWPLDSVREATIADSSGHGHRGSIQRGERRFGCSRLT